MKKFFGVVFLTGALLSASLIAEPLSEEKQGHELCLFTEDVFNALLNMKKQNMIQSYEKYQDPGIQELAEKFRVAFQEGTSSQEKEAAISQLGRLIKCSVDKDYELPYTLHRKELEEKVGMMEQALKSVLPNDPNYHKLMIESLANEKWDVALYSYLKIAESRCLD